MEQRIKIDGELYTVKEVIDNGYGYLASVICECGCEFYVAESNEVAGEAASKYWRDMAIDDPKEFACIIGEERLVQWAMNQSDSFGICGLDDFCERNADVPEENFASYDGCERQIDRYGTIANDLGFHPTVAYRHN